MRQPPNAAARSLAIPPGTAAVTCKVPEPFPRSSGPREASCRIYGRRPAALYSPLRESTLSAIPPPSDKPQRQYRLRSIRPKRAAPSSSELRVFGHPPVVPGEMPARRGPDRPADGTRTR